MSIFLSIVICANLFGYVLGENVVTKKRVEDVMPIATGLEREELEAELEVSFLIICEFI